MAGFDQIIDSPRETVEARRPDLVFRANNHAAHAPAAVFAPLPDLSGQLHESEIPVFHLGGRFLGLGALLISFNSSNPGFASLVPISVRLNHFHRATPDAPSVRFSI